MSHDSKIYSGTEQEQPRAALWRDRGASLVEYALLLGLIAVVCIGALTLLGGGLSDRIEGDAQKLEQAGK